MENYFTLKNKEKIPAIGFGTWMIKDGREAETAIRNAIETGYRHIDTAALYANEKGIGRGIMESGIQRDELFVTSKVWNTDRGYETTLRAFERSLNDLQLDYLDLYLIHWPATSNSSSNWKQINADTWRALEELHEAKLIRSIGVSNFMPQHLAPLMETASVLPVVNQIEYHPGFMQHKCVEFCREHNILVEAWAPLGTGKMLSNETLQSVSGRYDRSVAQICIRWALQHEVLPLPKSGNPLRMKENLEVMDFEISPGDMQIIDKMSYFGGSGLDPDEIDF